MIEIKNVRLLEKDLVKMNLIHSFKSLLSKLIYYVVLPIGIVFAIFNVLQLGFNTSTVLYIIAVAVLAATPLISILGAKRIYRSNKLIQKPFNYKIDDEKIHFDNESGDSNIEWKDVFDIMITKEYLIIYISQRQTLTIPLRYVDEYYKPKLIELAEEKKNLLKKK